MTFETVVNTTRMEECPYDIAEGRYKHSIVAYENSFYIFGGLNDEYLINNYFNDLIRYEVKTETWSQVIYSGTPPTPRCDHSAVIYRSSMFVFGGCIEGKKPTNDLYEYQFETNFWIKYEYDIDCTLPEPRQGHIAAVYDDCMWIFSGHKNTAVNDMWRKRLSSVAHKWEKITLKGFFDPEIAHNCPMVVVRGQMYILIQTKITHFFVFNFKDCEWSKLKSPPITKNAYAISNFGHQLIVFGKRIEPLNCYDLNYHIWSDITADPESDIWYEIEQYKTVFFEDALYVFSGRVVDDFYPTDLYKIQLKRKYSDGFLRLDYIKILTNALFTDVEFVVGEKEIKIRAHIAIVAARSEWLRACIREKSTETKDSPMLQVKLTTEPKVFEIMLKYIYTGQINLQPENLLLHLDLYSLAAEVTMNNLRELIVKQLCKQFLEKSITLANVLKVLSKANNFGLLGVKEYCLNFIINDVNYLNVVESVEFEALDNSLLVEITRKKIKPVSSQMLSSDETLDSNHSTLVEDMKVFLNSVGKAFSDVTILVGDDSIPAHKCVLAARSSYFEALFRSFMPADNIIRIKIGEIIPSKEVVDVLLKYIYYEDLNIPIEHSFILYFAADFYGFRNNRVQRTIKKNLKLNGTFDQLVQFLEEAHITHQIDLKKYLLELIVKLCPDISSWAKTPTLPQELWIDIVSELASTLKNIKLDTEAILH